jgi:hypothetical protein
MCARRFLIFVFVLILLTVAGAFALFQWGGNVLLTQATPRGHFAAAEAGAGADYAANEAWLTRPGVDWPDNPVEWRPANAPLSLNGDRTASVFYVHPTTYFERDRWNAPLRPAGGYTDSRTRLFLQSQASAFNDIAEIWAPRYRQAAYGAFLLDSKDARAALHLAYRDVAAAFDAFVAGTGDRPVILAGHSQGALHLERLLKEKVAGKPVAKRIVAAYVVGWPISTTADLPALGLGACDKPDAAGCLLSWMSFAEPANPEIVLHSYEDSAGFLGTKRQREDMLCVNPISGTRDGAAPPQANPGVLVPSADLRSAELLAGTLGAHCDQGLLILDGAIPALGPYVLPGNNYHVYDYALFWGAIRRDAARRLAAWRR